MSLHHLVFLKNLKIMNITFNKEFEQNVLEFYSLKKFYMVFSIKPYTRGCNMRYSYCLQDRRGLCGKQDRPKERIDQILREVPLFG